MRNLFLLVIFLATGVQAQEVSVMEQSPLEDTVKNWFVEGQFNSQSIARHSTFGPGLYYTLNSKNLLGVRYLAPVGESGVTHRLTQDISFGGIAGADWTSTEVAKDYVVIESTNTTWIYPRLALFTSLNF